MTTRKTKKKTAQPARKRRAPARKPARRASVPDAEATPFVTRPAVIAPAPTPPLPTHRPPKAGERRTWRRIPFFRTVRCRFASLDALRSDIAADLSMGGVFLRTETPEPIGSVVFLEIDLEDGTRVIAAYGKVVRVNLHPTAEMDPGMGIEFLKLDEASRERIRQLVAERFQPPARR